MNAGKGPIGFLNPSLYANPSMLNDITNGKCSFLLNIPSTTVKLRYRSSLIAVLMTFGAGSNPGCNTIGFSAVPGWVQLSFPCALIQY